MDQFLITQYVTNHVVAITEKIPACNWRHVASTDNPVNLESRGTTAGAFIQSSHWWTCPSWPQQSPDHWPVKNLQDQVLLPEVKFVAFALEMKPPAEDLSLRYSSFCKFILGYADFAAIQQNSRQRGSGLLNCDCSGDQCCLIIAPQTATSSVLFEGTDSPQIWNDCFIFQFYLFTPTYIGF